MLADCSTVCDGVQLGDRVTQGHQGDLLGVCLAGFDPSLGDANVLQPYVIACGHVSIGDGMREL